PEERIERGDEGDLALLGRLLRGLEDRHLGGDDEAFALHAVDVHRDELALRDERVEDVAARAGEAGAEEDLARAAATEEAVAAVAREQAMARGGLGRGALGE